MGNIGDSFTQTIPAVGTAGTGYATSVNDFLEEVKDRLEAPVPLSSILIEDLDMTNSALQNVGYLSLYPTGSAPTTPTYSLQTYNGDIYWVSPSGAVQITDGSTINAAGIGGITGDYGGVDPAQLRFTGADQMYYFYDDYAGGAWARLFARSLDVAGDSTGTERVRLSWLGSGSSYTLTLPSAVPASTSLVQMDASGNLTATNSLATDESITLSGTGRVKHGTRHDLRTMKPLAATMGTVSFGTDGDGVTGFIATLSSVFYVALDGFSNNDRIGTITFKNNNTGAATHTYALYFLDSSGLLTLQASTTSALNSVTLTCNSTLSSSYVPLLKVTMGAGACTFIQADISWTRV